MNRNSKATSYVLLTAVGALVILAAAWLLLISPVLTAAAEANEQALQQESMNDTTQIQVNKLQAQFANMDEYEAQLADLQLQIPTSQGYADLQRLFASVAEKHNVVITSLQFGNGTLLEPAAAGEGEPTGETTDPTVPSPSPSPQPTAGATGTDGTASADAPSLAKLYSIPVSVTMEGAYDDLMAAVNELQTGEARLVLVTTVTLSPTDALEGESAGTTAVFAGETFVLTSSALSEQSPEGESTDGSSPSPSPTP